MFLGFQKDFEASIYSTFRERKKREKKAIKEKKIHPRGVFQQILPSFSSFSQFS